MNLHCIYQLHNFKEHLFTFHLHFKHELTTVDDFGILQGSTHPINREALDVWHHILSWQHMPEYHVHSTTGCENQV